MSHKSIKNYPTNDKNPFQKKVIEHVGNNYRKKFTTDRNSRDVIVDADSGDVKGVALFCKEIKTDKAEFRKIYVSSLAEHKSLSKVGEKMLKYVLLILEKNKDYVTIDMKKAKEYTGYNSDRSIINGIGELIDCDYLARGNIASFYYINPTIYFNGDRIDLVKRYVLENEKSENTIVLNTETKQLLRTAHADFLF